MDITSDKATIDVPQGTTDLLFLYVILLLPFLPLQKVSNFTDLFLKFYL